MPRRLPTFFPLTLAAAVGLFALTSVRTAQPPAAPATAPGDGLKRTQEDNLKLYKRFADELLKLAQRWEKSDNPDEKERAKTLRAALKVADEKGVENLFKGVVKGLDTKNPNGGDFQVLFNKDAELLKALELILDTLDTEDEIDRLRKDIKDTAALKKEVERIKREQDNIIGRTQLPKADPNKIAKDQKDLAGQTKDLAGKTGDKGDSKGGKPDGKDDKSDPKGEPKPGENTGEQKPDTKESKSDGKDPMGGEPKDPKAGEPKPSPMKPDAGVAKESPKDGMGDPMAGKGMGEPKPMTGDPKAAKPMQGDGKAQGDNKGDSKPSDGMGGEGKPMPGGMPSDSPPSGSKPSGSSPSGSPPPNAPPPNPNDQIRTKLEDVVPDQNGAADDLKKNDRPAASKKEDDASKKLDDIIKELEKRLKQLREKEMLKKLEDLERRVTKMLKLQIEVYGATQAIDGVVKKNKGVMTTLEKQKSGVESEKEGVIAEEAGKALKLLEGEGTAVVFAGVLSELRKDMEAVQKQLNGANVGDDTQLVEKQIIEQLQRMLEALKKAKQDLQNPPPPPPPGEPPPDQKDDLIKLVEQLKLLRALQVQLNERTTAFGKRTPGEQTADPFVTEQLKQLAERQKFLQELLKKVASELDPRIRQ